MLLVVVSWKLSTSQFCQQNSKLMADTHNVMSQSSKKHFEPVVERNTIRKVVTGKHSVTLLSSVFCTVLRLEVLSMMASMHTSAAPAHVASPASAPRAASVLNMAAKEAEQPQSCSILWIRLAYRQFVKL